MAVAGGTPAAETMDTAVLAAKWLPALEARLVAAEAGACSQAPVGSRNA